METYKVETFTKEWNLYASNCKDEKNKPEYMFCNALTDCDLNFANALLDLDLIKDPDYVYNAQGWQSQALIIAACKGDLIIIKKLKDKGANLNAYNCTDTTALMCAVRNNQCESVKLLIDLGADVDFRINDNDTPLMMAAERRYINIFTMLLEAGADINIKNKKLLTVTDILNGYLSINDITLSMESKIETMIDLLNKKKEKKENVENITTMNKPKNKCNYGTHCLNFKKGTCSLDHIADCVYGKDCINYKQGICLLEH